MMVFARSWVVGKDITQGLAWQHRLIDGRDLAWKGFHVRSVDRHHRIEKVREVDPICFCGELEIRAGSVERPGTTLLGKRKGQLVRPKQHSLQESSVRCLVIDGKGSVSNVFGRDDMDGMGWINAGNG
jgi:hypothetical protein